MSEKGTTCVQCGRGGDAAPVLAFEYQGKTYGICFEHLPIMIHRPGELAGKLPNAGEWIGQGSEE